MTRGKKLNKITMKRGNRGNKKTNYLSDINGINNIDTPKEYYPVQPPSYLPKRVMNIHNISPDELIFAYEWANNPNNPDKALLSSGITKKTDTPGTVKTLVQEYTKNPQVLKAFHESLFNRLESLQITESRIDSHLSVMAFTDIGLSKDEIGNILPLERMPWEMRMCIQEYEEKTFYPKEGTPYKRTKIKCYNRMDAVKTLRQHKKEDKALAMGIIKGTGGDTFIQNIQNQNIIGSQNNYNSEVKNVLDLGSLGENELDIFLKAVGHEVSPQAILVENMVNDMKETIQV